MWINLFECYFGVFEGFTMKRVKLLIQNVLVGYKVVSIYWITVLLCHTFIKCIDFYSLDTEYKAFVYLFIINPLVTYYLCRI